MKHRAEPVAIVGIGCRFPGGADSPRRFWELLCNGIDAIRETPRERLNLDELFDPDPAAAGKLYTRWGGYLDAIDEFDADFFGIAPREARRIDPQQRLLLEVVWEALEHAGLPADQLAGTRAGVFIGISSHDYTDVQVLPLHRERIDAHFNAGGATCIAANRISYLLDLRGPSFAVDTACSSSLTALHLACRSLEAGDCEVAIVGGVNVLLAAEPTIGFCRATMLSPDGRCHTFDARANGYVRAEGAGAVVLKPLIRAVAEGDIVHSIVRGTAINQDGRTPGMSLPSAEGQAAMLRQALAAAGVPPNAVQYVEAHGTGTAAGDPIEAEAIGRVFSEGRAPGEYCIVGSVKTNLGHLEAGAGLAGLIKATLALQHRKIPPNLHFSVPNPAIRFDELRLRVPTRLEDWPASVGPAMAGVNSFGFGGANAHAVLEEPPPELHPLRSRAEGERESVRLTGSTRGKSDNGEDARVAPQILVLSARSPAGLPELAERHAHELAEPASPIRLGDRCYTAAVRRSHHEHRLAAVATSAEEMAHILEQFRAGEEVPGLFSGRGARNRCPKLAFVFTGMGAQWWGMGRQLLQEEPTFRLAVQEVDGLLGSLTSWSLLEELQAEESDSRITRTDLVHVANFAIQSGLVALLRSWGIQPDAVVGHSSGEMAAAYAAGALTLADAVRLAFERGRLQHRTSGTGRMLAIAAGPTEAARLIAGHESRVALAALNGPTSVTLSGDARILEHIAGAFASERRFCRFLPVDVPYHGPQMDAIREDLLSGLATLRPRASSVPFVSEVTGDFLNGTELDPHYWWRNVRQPVRFAAAVERLIEHGCEIFLEIGPHPILSPSIAETCSARGASAAVVATLRRGDDERRSLLNTLAALHVRGRRVDWRAVYPAGAVVPLPNYPWQRERHWFEPDESGSPRGAGTPTGHPLLRRRVSAPRPAFEVALGEAQLAYLDQHVVQDTVVFPAAGYVEMMLAAGHHLYKDGTVTAEQLRFRRLLFLAAREKVVLQLEHDPDDSSVRIHAATPSTSDDWVLHASSKLRRAPSGQAEPPVLLDPVRQRCTTELDVAALYDSFERRGLRYGPAFQAIRGLWQRSGEALARIGLEPEPARRAGSYRVHPALLDAAFQVLGSAAAGAGGGPLVPVSLEKVTLHAPPGAACWAHARVTKRADQSVTGNVTLLDHDGSVLLDCRGLELRALEGEQRQEITDWLYEIHWEETPLPAEPAGETIAQSLPDPPSIAASLGETMIGPAAATAAGLSRYYEEVEPALDRIAVHHVRRCMRVFGWTGELESGDPVHLADRLGVVPQHHRLFRRLLEILRMGEPAGDDDLDPLELATRVLVDHPRHSAEFELLERCASRLPEVLRGQLDPRDLLFGDNFAGLARLYAASPISSQSNELAAEVIARAARHATRQRPLRVLEIGAGTGALTAAVLERVGDAPIEYVFTDISTYFLNRARATYGGRAGMRFALFDIEDDPDAQHLAPASFDIVLGANVVHATEDLRRTLTHLHRVLAPGGLLVLVEVTRRAPFFDLIFGPLEGWWRFADHELRPAHPLLSRTEWSRPLRDAGFSDVTAVADPPPTGEPMMSVLLARHPAGRMAVQPAPAVTESRRWLLFADRGGRGETIAEALRAQGDHCLLVQAGAEFTRLGDNRFEITPTGGTIERLLCENRDFHGIVHLWSLDIGSCSAVDAEDIMSAQALGCGSALELVQALDRTNQRPSALWLVTAGAQAVDLGDPAGGVAQAPLWGFGRVLRNEQPTLNARLVDLSENPTQEEIQALITELGTADSADEVALRRRRRWVQRLQRGGGTASEVEGPLRMVSSDTSAFQLEIPAPGALDTLRLREVTRAQPPPGHVLIRVLAAGLNFRDVMLALGMLPPAVVRNGTEAGTHSVECAGVIVACGADVTELAPGDEVIALAIGALGSHAIARTELVVHKPPHLSFEEAASIPGVYLTARYGLMELARVQPGERVLIHSASGGVGHAALELCHRLGATVFATAGTAEKQAYLRGLGVEHVMSSRSLDWADEVLERTGGEGVDVVLNSLAGPAIRKGLEVLRPFGRFVEIGKRDIYENTELGLLPFRKNLGFFSVDLVRLCDERPVVAGAMLREVVNEVAEGVLPLPPRRVFDIARAEDAYRLMAQARHTGKLVITLQEHAYAVLPDADRPPVRPDATYLITGGLGGFGLAVAGWLVRQGARHLVLLSRSGEVRDNGVELERLQAAATLRIVRADVASAAELSRVIAEIGATMPPLRGVLHLAMVLDDGMLTQLDQQRFDNALRPKVAGAWNLHRLTQHHALDFFVLFSSISSVIGHPLQANYAAGNTFLDSLAAHRRAQRLPGLSISWGTVAEVGYVARHGQLQQHLARLGIESLTPAQALAALEIAMRGARPHLIAARLDWSILQKWNRTQTRLPERAGEGARPASQTPGGGGGLLEELRASDLEERSARLEAHTLRRVSKVLGSSVEKIEPERPLTDMGLDSLLAVELLTSLKIDLGVQIPVVKLLQGASTRELTQLVLAELGLANALKIADELRPADQESTSTDEPLVLFDESRALSFEQRRFWYLERLQPGNPALHLFAGARLIGQLDAGLLLRSLQETVARHEMLRSCYRDSDGQPVQAIASWAELPFRMIDLSEEKEDEREAALQRVATEDIRRPFDLARPPLLRALLVRLTSNEHALLLAVHHIVADAWAMTLVARDAMAIYGALSQGREPSLPPPPIRYDEYVRRQAQISATANAAEQLAWWQQHLEGAQPLQLLEDWPRGEATGSRGARLQFEVSEALARRLGELGRTEGSTLFPVLLAAFQALLHGYTGATDITVGTPVLRRDQPGLDELVGCCMNTLALRADLSGDPSFRELLRRARTTTLEALARQDVPFDAVVQALRPRRDARRMPLFRTMLILHNLRWPELRMGALEVRSLAFDSSGSVSDLTLLVDTGERLNCTLEYNGELFTRHAAAAMIERFRSVLEAIVQDPDVPLSRLPLLQDTDRQQVLVEWNRTGIAFGEPYCLHELVDAQVARTPDALAVVSEKECVTYGELDARAARLARALRDSGARPGAIVAVCMERSVELVVAVLAALKAGAAFLPLDPTLPPARLERMLRQASARVLIVNGGSALEGVARDGLGSWSGAIVCASSDGLVDKTRHADSAGALLEQNRGETRTGEAAAGSSASPHDLAYVIFTSGSTGEPKGVMVPHRAICNQVRWRQHAFPLGGEDAVLLRTPVGFDPAIWELFGPLTAGARIVVPPPDADRDPARLTAVIAEHGVTTLQVVPSLLEALLDHPGFTRCDPLRRVLCGGEPLKPDLVRRFFSTTSAELHNLYGPAETTIDATWFACQPDNQVVPIGRPIANVRAYVLDERLEPVPPGLAGELYIGGSGVTLGYLCDPEQTRERFVIDPFSGDPEARLYRTGDRARWLHDGQLEFLGRFDSQMKIRGVRVEPTEIEGVLCAHPAVREAAVIATGAASANVRLIALVVQNAVAGAGVHAEANQQATPTIVDALQRFLAARLPSVMIPSIILPMPILPRTSAGKLDRERLAREVLEYLQCGDARLDGAAPRSEASGTARVAVPPRDAVEAQLLAMWARLLEVGPVGVTDNFFELGGHSLLAIRLLAQMQRTFGAEIPLAALIENPTVESIARLLRPAALAPERG